MNTCEIVQLLRNKEEKGLVYLYDNYSAALYGIILRILNSEKLAEDVLQQTFLKVWDKIALYDESKSQLFTWMSVIARNIAIDVKRLKKYENNKNTSSLDLNVHNLQNNQMSLAGMDVHPLISKLDEKHRNVLDCIYLNGYTQSEAATKLNIPLGTVKTRVKNAILKLREILKNEKALFVSSFTSLIILVTFLCQ